MKKIMPPRIFLFLLCITIIIHFVYPIKKIIQSPYKYSGILLIIFGIILNIWADSLFKKRKTTVKPHEKPKYLETSGPFKISRHPMYLGMLSILLGTSIILGSIITFIFPIIFIALIELFFIQTEEKNCEKIFGKKYLEYKKKIRRWL